MGSRIYLAAFAVSVVMFNSDVASGQSSNASVSASYTLLRDTDLDFTFKRGVSFGGAYRLHEWLFVVAELAISAHHQDYSAVQGRHLRLPASVVSSWAARGARFGRVQPYIEVLAGGTRLGIWERRLDRTASGVTRLLSATRPWRRHVCQPTCGCEVRR
jgi:hypothetical protein